MNRRWGRQSCLASGATHATHTAEAVGGAVDKAVQGHGLALGTGCDGVGFAHRQSGAADDHAIVGPVRGESGQDIADAVRQGYVAGNIAVEVHQNGPLGGIRAEVLGHAAVAHGDDRTGGDGSRAVIVQGCICHAVGEHIDLSAGDIQVAIGV